MGNIIALHFGDAAISKILLVEDELELAEEVREWLVRDKHAVEIVGNGQAAIDLLRVSEFDLIVLDVLLPGLNGFEVCKSYRSRGGQAAILMLTAQTTIDDKEMGLDCGADDYLCKPFSLRELSARVRAVLRRASGIKTNVLEARDIVLDPTSRTVSNAGAEVHLEPKEFALLEFFMRNPNTVFSADALIKRVWESDTVASPEAIRTYIKGLRQKLPPSGGTALITTIHGLGYRFNV